MKLEKEAKHFFDSLKFPVLLVVLLWAIHIAKVTFKLNLGRYGVFPRAWDGLKGIVLSPFIHGDFQHLFSNSFPVFFLTFMILYFYRKIAAVSIFLIYIITGFAVWLLAREVYHIGASGVVYGLVAFVFWSGLFRRNVRSIVLALVVLFLYQGYFLGIVPNQEGISWESHLIGGVVGIIIAFVFKGVKEDDEEKIAVWEETEEEAKPFFARDVFEKTREERRIEIEQARQEQLRQYHLQQERLRQQREQQRNDNYWNSNNTST